jgi:hemerythrin superfamily protein
MTRTQASDLVELIIADHHDFERMFAELERGAHSADYRKRLTDHLIAHLTRHAVAEEQLLYPTARDKLPDGDELADHEIEEHNEAEAEMKELEGLEPLHPEFERLVGKLIEDVRHHLEEEEGKLLPKIRSACSPDELHRLGRSFELAKQGAPTRPHPSTPDRPPGNLIISPGVGIIDKVRDVLSKRNV